MVDVSSKKDLKPFDRQRWGAVWWVRKAKGADGGFLKKGVKGINNVQL